MAKNIKDILIGATQFPAAIEAKLPAGAPKISDVGRCGRQDSSSPRFSNRDS